MKKIIKPLYLILSCVASALMLLLSTNSPNNVYYPILFQVFSLMAIYSTFLNFYALDEVVEVKSKKVSILVLNLLVLVTSLFLKYLDGTTRLSQPFPANFNIDYVLAILILKETFNFSKRKEAMGIIKVPMIISFAYLGICFTIFYTLNVITMIESPELLALSFFGIFLYFIYFALYQLKQTLDKNKKSYLVVTQLVLSILILGAVTFISISIYEINAELIFMPWFTIFSIFIIYFYQLIDNKMKLRKSQKLSS